MTIRDYSFKTKSGLSFEVTATSNSESRAKTTSRNDLFAFCHGLCTPEWWVSLPGAMVQHDGPNRAFMAPGSEIHHSVKSTTQAYITVAKGKQIVPRRDFSSSSRF